jgi:uncharacterized membrane protein
VLLATGIINVFIGHWGFTTFWVLTAIVLYAALALLGALVYTPTLRRQIEVIQAEGPDSPAYHALSRKGQIVGVTLAVTVIVIIFLMVAKPSP